MNRELVLAALAEDPSTLQNPLQSRDSQLMVDALRAFETDIDMDERLVRITPAQELIGSTSIACGLAGTVMRFVPPVAALALGPVSFDGDPYARKRPMSALVQALRDLGADITDLSLPFTVHGAGSLPGGRVELDASASSQFVSALLLAAPRFENGAHIVHTGESLPSQPHIEMTVAALAARGVSVEQPADNEWLVSPGPIRGRDLTIEPDLSNAAPFLAAAVALGGSMRIPHWPEQTTQVGDRLREILTEFGASVSLRDGELTVTASGEIPGVNLHIPYAGELAPTLVGLAALSEQPSTITGIGHIRHHETDRIDALVSNINALGGQAEALEDGISLTPAPLHGGVWKSHADHRMATTGALLGLIVPDLEVDDIDCTSKTMPDFAELWNGML